MQARLTPSVFLMSTALSLWAQTFGDISGEVRDASGAVVPAVAITLENVDTSATRTAISNEAGIYSFPSLSPGNYRRYLSGIWDHRWNSHKYAADASCAQPVHFLELALSALVL